jgi:hypothetical protein
MSILSGCMNRRWHTEHIRGKVSICMCIGSSEHVFVSRLVNRKVSNVSLKWERGAPEDSVCQQIKEHFRRSSLDCIHGVHIRTCSWDAIVRIQPSRWRHSGVLMAVGASTLVLIVAMRLRIKVLGVCHAIQRYWGGRHCVHYKKSCNLWRNRHDEIRNRHIVIS